MRLNSSAVGDWLPITATRYDMVDRGNSRMVEYQDGDVAIVSHEPLIGTVELASDGEEIVQLQLDKDTAEQLLSVLLEFLAKGEGEDAPNLTIHGQH